MKKYLSHCLHSLSASCRTYSGSDKPQSHSARISCRPRNTVFKQRQQVLYLLYHRRRSGWGGYYYHAFSAPTIDGPWTDCGVVLDAKSEQVPWADGNLWAPAAIERKEGDSYKYYLYFSANNPESRRKEISVAVADDPAGPFTALPQPMIKDDPSRRGQQIDVDVFQDPVSGKYYLYWGNSFMAAPNSTTTLPQ